MSAGARLVAGAILACLALPAAGCGSEPSGDDVPFVAEAAARAGDCPGPRTQFGPSKPPPACWRPYSDASPFNRTVPAKPRIAADSDAVIGRLTGWGPPQRLAAGHSKTDGDYFHPVYWSRASDPLYTVHCVRYGSCPIEGHRVRIPAAARPAGGDDAHMAVIDTRSGWEYDFWQVRPKSRNGGRLTVSHGGRTRIAGKGLGSNATAAWFGLAAGQIRGAEMAAGRIDHAIFTTVRCTSGTSVYPAHPGTSAAPCSTFDEATENAPPLGARIWLDLPAKSIERLDVPNWKKTLLLAMHRYGMIVGDTMSGHSSWGLVGESGAGYTSFGKADPWAQFAARVTSARSAEGYSLNFGDAVDWRRHLHIVDPCVSHGGC